MQMLNTLRDKTPPWQTSLVTLIPFDMEHLQYNRTQHGTARHGTAQYNTSTINGLNDKKNIIRYEVSIALFVLIGLKVHQ